MTISLRADSGGATGAIALNGSDKLVLNADGTLSGTANPATGLRTQALATMQKFADEFGSLFAANGYQKLPNGLIIQWIQTTNLGVQGALSNWPILFPTACLFAGVFCQNGASPITVAIGAKTNSQVGAYASTTNVSVGFIGIGY